MQFPDETKEKYTTEQVFAEHLALIAKNISAWVDLFTEDAVIEYPYASGTQRRLEGKEAIYDYIKEALAQMQNLMFTNICVYPTTNPNILWAEFHGEAVITATGRQYQQDYAIRLETREGKIVYYREYWNPMSAIKAWGGRQNLYQSFNADNAE